MKQLKQIFWEFILEYAEYRRAQIERRGYANWY